MRVVEPHEFKGVKHPKQKRKPTARLQLGLLLIICVYCAVILLRPIPGITASAATLAPGSAKPVTIAWPDDAQAAVGAVGYGELGSNGTQKQLPTASVAKVMTALAVLKQHPLKAGEQGPTITISQDDVDEYARTVAMDGSNVPVSLGEEISEYQALQALLLPSANNMAHTLARWAYGSDEKYLTFVNNFAKSLGMQQSYFDDASGFSPKTVSTAQDLVKLAVNAMDNPVIAEIAAQTDATIPVAGRIYNVNMLLGKDGIVGVKTGNTEEAGGCFMAAAVRVVNGQKITAVSVIMGSPNLYTALKNSVPLINSVLDGFETKTIVKAGEAVGSYSVPWGGNTTVVAQKELRGVVWRGTDIKPEVSLLVIRDPTPAGTQVGTVKARFGRELAQVDVTIAQSITEPSLAWRLIPKISL